MFKLFFINKTARAIPRTRLETLVAEKLTSPNTSLPHASVHPSPDSPEPPHPHPQPGPIRSITDIPLADRQRVMAREPVGAAAGWQGQPNDAPLSTMSAPFRGVVISGPCGQTCQVTGDR